ncbi:MAG: DMT family transporter [Pseudomonadota bacterium]
MDFSTKHLRLALLVTLTMVAFAANSLLNRIALLETGIGPMSFAAIRLASGAVALGLMVWVRRRGWPRLDVLQGLWLLVYALGFSFAYVSLDAGLGALLLFGVVKITMFAGAAVSGEPVPNQRLLGGGVAFGGLVYLLWPAGAGAPALGASVMMALAAIGWGLYSLRGRGATDPLGQTALAFILAAPIGLLGLLLRPDEITAMGAFYAVISGVVTSGLGYALWYHVLPQLGASRGAVAQLTVPVIAIFAGALLLGEPITMRILAATGLVIFGVGLALRAAQKPSPK